MREMKEMAKHRKRYVERNGRKHATEIRRHNQCSQILETNLLMPLILEQNLLVASTFSWSFEPFMLRLPDISLILAQPISLF